MEELRKEAEERIRREEVEANGIQKELAELALHIGMGDLFLNIFFLV